MSAGPVSPKESQGEIKQTTWIKQTVKPVAIRLMALVHAIFTSFRKINAMTSSGNAKSLLRRIDRHKIHDRGAKLRYFIALTGADFDNAWRIQ